MIRQPSKNILAVLLSLTVLILFAACSKAADSSVLNIFLVQNSGWMEPFYVDSNSKFRSIVAVVAQKVTPSGGEVAIASFNQSIGDNVSPMLDYRGSDMGQLILALKGMALAKKPDASGYTDTDFKEAIVSAITNYSPGRPCILWMFTNNKNSPNNSPETKEKNKEFYNWIQNENNIRRIAAYPFKMAVKGHHYKANGLMVYAFAYGESASEMLRQIVEAKLLFGEQPARLKPLNAEALTFIPTGAAPNAKFNALIDADGATLKLNFKSSSKPEVAVISGVVRNDFYPYDIRSGNVSLDVQFLGNSYGIQSAIEPRELPTIPAGDQSAQMTVRIGIPPLPSMWKHPEIIFKNGYQVSAVMTFTLTNQVLEISKEFVTRMDALFPGDPLPELFIPGESSSRSVTTRPLLVSVAYPIWPLIVFIGVCTAILFGLFWFFTSLTRPKKYVVVVEGIQKTYAVKAFGKCPLYSGRGDRIGSLARGLWRPITLLDEGHSEKVIIR